MISIEKFFGGYYEETLSGTHVLNLARGRYQALNPDGTNRLVTVPADPAGLWPLVSYGLVAVVENTGTTANSLHFRVGTTPFGDLINQDQVGYLFLLPTTEYRTAAQAPLLRDAADWQWYAAVRDVLIGP